MHYAAVAKKGQKHNATMDSFFLFADSKLLSSQKNVLVAALANEGKTCTGMCREISLQAGQDASTVRKTVKFFREVGLIDCGTRSSKGKKAALTFIGRELALMFAHGGK